MVLVVCVRCSVARHIVTTQLSTVKHWARISIAPIQKMDKRVETVRKAIKEYPDFPKKGIMFQDIFGVLLDPEANAALHDLALEHIRGCADRIDKIVGLDSRGFLFGNTMALAVNKPFVPIRKKGKLPGKCLSQTYSLEYGEDTLEVQVGSLGPGDRVLVVDDLLATGGTLSCAAALVAGCGAAVDHAWVVIELAALGGRARCGHSVEALIVMEDVE